MSKRQKIIIIIIVTLLLCVGFTSYASAEATSDDIDSLYRSQYEASGADGLQSALPKDVQKMLEEFRLDPSNPDTYEQWKPEQIWNVILDFISTGISKPLSVILAVLGVILILSAAEGLMVSPNGNMPLGFICFFAVISLLQPVISLVGSLQEAVQNLTTFMAAFVPVYAGLIASGGHAGTASGFSALLLAAAEGISYFISYVFLPIVSGTMSLGISGSVSPVGGFLRLADWIKKAVLWGMGITTTLFLGVLSVQTTITAAGDNLGIRTSKAVIAGSIPVMGPAIAETLNTARGCLTLLRSGVGIYGAVAVALLALPLIIELFCWRVGLWLCTGLSELFSIPSASRLFQTVDFVLAMMLGAIGFLSLLLIIAMTVVMKAGG